MPGGSVSVQRAFLYGFIDLGNRDGQQGTGRLGVSAFKGAAQLLDRSAQFRAIVTIDQTAALALAHTFFG
jgi:hypothetical protein